MLAARARNVRPAQVKGAKRKWGLDTIKKEKKRRGERRRIEKPTELHS